MHHLSAQRYRITWASFFAMVASSVCAQSPSANLPSDQTGSASSTSSMNPSSAQNVPSLDSAISGARGRSSHSNYQLPQDAGQYWQEYDLKPYTQQLKNVEQPQQAVIDWVLRETGTDVWFSQPMGVMSADRNTLRVYHNDAMQKVVKKMHERFVNGTTEPQVYGLRVITINNPNWRTRAMGWMKSVQVQAPGMHAWLLSKENSAMLLAMLRGRTDYREVQAGDIVVHNGQTSTLEQLRGRNYLREYQRTEQGWPPYLPVSSEIQEGYRLQISPLLSMDNQSLDVVLKCNIDQVERLKSVNVDLPMPNGQNQSAAINVPQLVSWRLHERFRWPADQTLLLSCGVIAAPSGTVDNTLLGQGSSLLGLDRIVPNNGDRADALLVLEYKGNASSQLSLAPTAGTPAAAQNPVSRGRY